MPFIENFIDTDEKVFQIKFYEQCFGVDNLEGNIKIDRSTDGYTDGIIFEHKTNVTAYGRSKALSQALIYLTRFNADGIPVPGKIMLVSQEERKVYIYETSDYIDIINSIPEYAKLKASSGIDGFTERNAPSQTAFSINNAAGMQKIINIINEPPTFVKVDISVHNVYGWSNYYYKNASKNNQKPEKKAFFDELRNPRQTLFAYINPWTGKDEDFKLIMDLLNDPQTQKQLGAFYTPEAYCKLASSLLKKAIERVPKGNDYVIIDRCAGTGNLESVLSDEELSHVIINTYELKEWHVLKERIGHRVRYIIPPIPNPEYDENGLENYPDLNPIGFLSGADALTKEFIDNLHGIINSTKLADEVSIILYENPPFNEPTSIENQKKSLSKSHSKDWKQSYVVNEMKKSNLVGTATNEMGNAFIWSAFEYFIKKETDSYVVFSPIKYWKAQKIIHKEFIDGYAMNRIHFHAKAPSCVVCALWSGKESNITEFKVEAINLSPTDECIDEGIINVRQINYLFSEKYYDKRPIINPREGIAFNLDGTERTDKKETITANCLYGDDVLAYMLVKKSIFDNARLERNLLMGCRYDAHGFYLRKDNFLSKLPMFAAGAYSDHINDWKVMSMVMKSGDGYKQYEKDVKSGKLDGFLCKTLIWTACTHYSHMRSLIGSDGVLYLNQLCFDGDDTLASIKLHEFQTNGYVLTRDDENLLDEWNVVINRVRKRYANGSYLYPYDETQRIGYNPSFKYGLYQIDEEVNYKIESAPDKYGKTHLVPNDGDLHNIISRFKNKVKEYYINNIVDVLFTYEFLK